MCKITGRRRHSKDLAQGGLEIPCILTFEGGSKDITKVEKLIRKLLTKQGETPADMKCPSEHASKDEPSRKTHTWIDQDVDTEAIRNGKKLTDCHVGFAQQLLKRQFPHLNGLQPKVLQAKKTL